MAIVANLMVSDMARAVAFYRDILGMRVTMAVTAARDVDTEGDATGAVFVTLDWNGAELMLQTASSLAGELPIFAAGPPSAPAGTLYFRGFDPATVEKRLAPEQIVKGPFQQWYGMHELYVRDPDGHILCLGVPAGEAPG